MVICYRQNVFSIANKHLQVCTYFFFVFAGKPLYLFVLREAMLIFGPTGCRHRVHTLDGLNVNSFWEKGIEWNSEREVEEEWDISDEWAAVPSFYIQHIFDACLISTTKTSTMCTHSRHNIVYLSLFYVQQQSIRTLNKIGRINIYVWQICVSFLFTFTFCCYTSKNPHSKSYFTIHIPHYKCTDARNAIVSLERANERASERNCLKARAAGPEGMRLEERKLNTH